MKNIIKLFSVMFIFIGCSTNSVVPDPQPTGDYKRDIYIQEWLTSYNLTFCQKTVDLENYLDGYFCMETGTDNKYYIPKEEWEAHKLQRLFLHVSKAQIRERMDKDEVLKDYICGGSNSAIDCKDLGQPHVIPEIQAWKEKE